MLPASLLRQVHLHLTGGSLAMLADLCWGQKVAADLECLLEESRAVRVMGTEQGLGQALGLVLCTLPRVRKII